MSLPDPFREEMTLLWCKLKLSEVGASSIVFLSDKRDPVNTLPQQITSQLINKTEKSIDAIKYVDLLF